MEEDPGNHLPEIHNEAYRQPFEKKRVGADQLICTAGRKSEKLNGQWHYAIDQYDACLRGDWFKEIDTNEQGMELPLDYDFDAWPITTLPACWNLSQEKLFLYEAPMVYTRRFQWKARSNERVFLRFGAASYNAVVFLNRECVGQHDGASTPFCMEITQQLYADNRILVVVENERRPERVPMQNTDWFNYGGLYRSIEIIRVPETFIKDFRLHLVPNGSFDTISAQVEANGPKSAGAKATLRIPELEIEATISLDKAGRGQTTFCAKPVLWSPDHPKLYECELSCGNDSVKEHIGFREIRTQGTDILLNGNPIFLRGVGQHEESVENGKAVTDAEIRENFRLIKEMNGNFSRMAHYPHTERAAQIADEMGILLWEEIPVVFSINFTNPQTYQDAENQLREMIIRDYNRASVAIWGLCTETPGGPDRTAFIQKLAIAARSEDSSRPLSAACLVDHIRNVISDPISDYLDIIGLNEYYGWYFPDFEDLIEIFDNSTPSKPVIISEFGTGARIGHHGPIEEKFTIECQERIYRQQTQLLGTIPYIKGISPWILFDFRCPRRTNPIQDYYNRKGMLDESKQHRKPAYFVMQEFYRGIQEQWGL